MAGLTPAMLDAIDALARLEARLPAGLLFESAQALDRTHLLYESELAAVTSAVAARRCEFSTGRWLARQALRRLGRPPCPVPMGVSREPLWPDGVVGSITHSATICAVVLGTARDYRGLGLDLELTNTRMEELAGIIVTRADTLREGSPDDLRLAFSAKEAVYKCTFPLHGEFLEFRDVAVAIDHASSTFSAKVNKAEARSVDLASGQGLFEAKGNAVVTVYRLPASERPCR